MIRQQGWLFVVFFCCAALAVGCGDDTSNTGGGDASSGSLGGFDFRPDDTSSSSSGVDSSGGGCTEGEQSCLDSTTLQTCTGGAYVSETCEGGNICRNNACLPPEMVCSEAGVAYECDSTLAERVCADDMLSYTVNPCGAGETCNPATGECGNSGAICAPGTFKCGNNTPQRCSDDGTTWEDTGPPCAEKESCSVSEGRCVSLCEADTKDASFLGCEYFVVDMDNSDSRIDQNCNHCINGSACDSLDWCFDGDSSVGSPCIDDSDCSDGFQCNGNSHIGTCLGTDLECFLGTDCGFILTYPCEPLPPHACERLSHDDHPFGITISNPKTVSADVTVIGAGETISVTVAPGSLESVELNPGTDADTGGIHSGATFFVQSDVPVTVHQFNPLNGGGVFSNDASLLLPTTSAGMEYIVTNYPSSGGPVYLDVVAIENDTTVELTNLKSEAIPGVSFPQTHTLQQGQLLHVLTDGVDGADLSGVQVSASKPVSVFAGAQCINIPSDTPYCDHVEQQLFPVPTWGMEYFAAKFSPRGTEDDVWRITAAENGTTVTLSPAQNGQSIASLNAGQTYEIRSSGHFKISSNNPITVGQFMTGSTYTGIPDHSSCLGAIGDPAFTLAVPTVQYRSDYIVLTPTGYLENFLNVIAPDGTIPRLDGSPVNEVGGISSSVEGMTIYQIPVAEGPHFLQGTGVFGVVAYGYNCDVSYAYPGGLDLAPLN